MKTIKNRIETLEERNGSKPILVLWGDWEDENICHIGGMRADETLPWPEAEERFGKTHDLICVHYVEEWRNDE